MYILQPPRMVSGGLRLFSLQTSSPHTQRISEWTAPEVKSNGLFEREADCREVSHSSAPRDVIKSGSQRYAIPERRRTHKILATVGGFGGQLGNPGIHIPLSATCQHVHISRSCLLSLLTWHTCKCHSFAEQEPWEAQQHSHFHTMAQEGTGVCTICRAHSVSRATQILTR